MLQPTLLTNQFCIATASFISTASFIIHRANFISTANFISIAGFVIYTESFIIQSVHAGGIHKCMLIFLYLKYL
jgi:hypothetical protein